MSSSGEIVWVFSTPAGDWLVTDDEIQSVILELEDSEDEKG